MKLLIYILLCVCPLCIHAQQTAGLHFTDAKTKEPVEGVTIEVKKTGRFYNTSADGKVFIPVTGTSTEVIFFALGYKTDSLTIGETAQLNIPLVPKPMNLKEVTVLAPVAAQKPLNLVSKIDLKLRPVKSSQELLQLVPGLFIAQHQGGGKAEQIFLRGFDIDHGTDVAISTDGIPVNMVSHAHGQGYADLHYVIPETVKNIDFGAGPHYTAYGNLATAGYINFETQDRLPYNKVQLEAGSFNTFRGLAMIQLPLKKDTRQDAYFASEYLYSDGPFESPQHFNRFNFFTKYNRQLRNNAALSVSASAFTSKWNASGQIPARAVESGMIGRFGAIDDDEGGNTGRSQFSVTLKNNLRNNVSLKNQLYAVHYTFDLFSNFTFFLNDPVNGDQVRQREHRNIFGYTGSLLKNHREGKGNGVTTAGWGIRADRTNGSGLSHTFERTTTLEQIQLGDIHETNYFAFLGHSYTQGKWQFGIGSRFDGFVFGYHNRLTGEKSTENKLVASPKLNIDYRVNKNLLFFAKAGKGFHSNDTRVAISGTTTHILPSAFGVDAGLTLKPVKGMILTATAWYLYLQQEFIYVGDEGVTEPGGRTKRKGIDLVMRYQLTPNLFASLNMNRAIAKDIDADKGDNLVPLAPRFTATGGLCYQDNKKFSAAIYCRHMGNRPANASYTLTAPGYTVTDIAVNYRINKLELGIAAENIFNVEWNEAQFETTSRLQNESSPVTELNYTPGAPFALRLKVGLRF